MEIKSKITSFFGKIRSFSFLWLLLDRKVESLKKEQKTNEKSIIYYESKISDAVKEIKDSKVRIENLEQCNNIIKEYILDIKKLE